MLPVFINSLDLFFFFSPDCKLLFFAPFLFLLSVQDTKGLTYYSFHCMCVSTQPAERYPALDSETYQHDHGNKRFLDVKHLPPYREELVMYLCQCMREKRVNLGGFVLFFAGEFQAVQG